MRTYCNIYEFIHKPKRYITLITDDKYFAIEENETKETTFLHCDANISGQAKKGLLKINRESRNGSTII